MSVELVNIKNSKNSTFKEWYNFYKNHESSIKNKVLSIYSTIEDYEDISLGYIRYYRIHKEDAEDIFIDDFWNNHGVKKIGGDFISLFSFDKRYSSKEDNIVDLDDFLINPCLDLYESLVSVLIVFQQKGWGGVRLDCRFMCYHNSFIEILKRLGAIELEKYYYVISLREYKHNNNKNKHNLIIDIKGSNIETTCSIFQSFYFRMFGYNSCDKYRSNNEKMYKTMYNIILFEKPILYDYNDLNKTYGNSDIIFDLEIDAERYKECECKEECKEHFCNNGFNYRRLNKLERLEIHGFNHEKGYSYCLLYGICVPKYVSKCNECIKCGYGGMVVMNNEKDKYHTYVHNVPYDLSLWLSRFSISEKEYKSPVLKEIDNYVSNKNEEKNDNKKELKQKRRSIPRSVRSSLWQKYFGDSRFGKCYCCEEELDVIRLWHAGHIVSHKNGGKDDVSNLRPVCMTCNLSMGIENMDEFKERCFSNK